MDCLVLSGLNVACGFTPGRVLPSGLPCRRLSRRSVAPRIDAVADSGDLARFSARRNTRRPGARAQPSPDCPGPL
jgi:hypothetical protein